jgi:hypothetical protein
LPRIGASRIATASHARDARDAIRQIRNGDVRAGDEVGLQDVRGEERLRLRLNSEVGLRLGSAKRREHGQQQEADDSHG